LRDSTGNGTSNTAIVIWTGHILEGNERSDASPSRHSVVITPHNTTIFRDGEYVNKTATEIYNQSCFTLIHEISHLFGAPDHYCYGKNGNEEKCENLDCDECQYSYDEIRVCIMGELCIELLDEENIYCSDCTYIINTRIGGNH